MAAEFKSANGDNWEEGGSFAFVAKLSGMPVEEWRSIAHLVPFWPERQSFLRHLLRKTGHSGTQLYFFDNCVLQIYEGTIAFSHFELHTRVTRERIKGKNEVIDPSAQLAAEVLRNICVVLEALVYKSIHILYEGQRPTYNERSETYEARLDRLVSGRHLEATERKLGMELYSTRCEFAHSIKSVADLRYLSEPLSDRWGSSGSSQRRVFKRYFLPDAFCYSEALLRIFKPIQGQQFDGAAFREALLDRVTCPDDDRC